MIEIKKCPICDNNKFLKFIKCIDHSVSKESFNLQKCESCNFVLTNPRPNNVDLNNYYKSDKYISHTNKKDGFFNKLYQFIRKIAIRKKLSLIKKYKKNITILDIGCGTGEFLYACKKRKWDVIGIEPSGLASKKAKENYDLQIVESISSKKLKNKNYNIITMWHVLEHVTEINETLLSIKKLLAEDGYLIIAVPNYKSYDASYYKEYWAAYDVPIHLWHFSEKTISTLLKKYNLSLIKKKGMIFDSFYVSLLSEEFKYGKKNFLKAAIVGLKSNFLALIGKKDYSSMIYIFKNTK